MFAQVLDNEFARDVRAGLTRGGQKTLPCRYLYDDLGSALFDAITWLPEYGLTRADARVIEAHAGDLAECLPGEVVVAELGSGSGGKTRAILDSFARRRKTEYYPIDVSATALERCARELISSADVFPITASYLDGLREVTSRREASESLLVLFLGSTIGNFEPEPAIDFLYGVRQQLAAGDALLLGTDLVKPVEVLLSAYDDPAGVTSAFNLNLLARINRELDGDFKLRSFEHVARYDAAAQRVEMHLRSKLRQAVTVRQAEVAVTFENRETIWTEACYKFRPEQVCQMARAAGFRLEQQWTDQEWPFAESLLRAV